MRDLDYAPLYEGHAIPASFGFTIKKFNERYIHDKFYSEGGFKSKIQTLERELPQQREMYKKCLANKCWTDIIENIELIEKSEDNIDLFIRKIKNALQNLENGIQKYK